MLIGTLEALDRAKVGEKFKVDGINWERVADGLKGPNEQVLPLIAFEGLADAKKIRTESDLGITFPTWRSASNHGWYLLLAEDPVTGAIISLFWDRYGTYNTDVHVLDESQVTALSTPTTYPTVNTDTAVQLFSMLTKFLMPNRAFFGATQVGVTSGLLDDLHAMAEATPGLDEVLVKHNVGRMRTGTVAVSAKGTAKITSGLLGDGLEVDDIEVGWRFAYDYPATAPITAPCLCVTFDEDRFKTRLPQNMVAEEHKTECSEKDCVNKKVKGNRPARTAARS